MHVEEAKMIYIAWWGFYLPVYKYHLIFEEIAQE